MWVLREETFHYCLTIEPKGGPRLGLCPRYNAVLCQEGHPVQKSLPIHLTESVESDNGEQQQSILYV